MHWIAPSDKDSDNAALEKRLWDAADQFRANSGFKSQDYSAPVLIFLRDTETVPLKVSIEEYFKRELLPHVPDAWIDTTKFKVGYEIPLDRHFYRCELPRPLEVTETDLKRLEDDIMQMLKEVTA
jgi:hypothetical protein